MMSTSGVYRKTILVKGEPTQVRCMDVAGHTLVISGGVIRIASVEDAWYDEIENPNAVIEEISAARAAVADLLTFWNPLPESEPRYDLPHERVPIAVLPVASYEEWWNKRIKSRTRNLIRKAEKQGLVVRESEFDDAFVHGMSDIFNEQRVRQGRRFWHFGKSPETVREQFSRFVHRETMIGAYVEGRMVGFIMLGSAGHCAHLGQILSRISERERNPNNALMAKAVEICARKGQEHLVYGFWGDTSLAEFKRRCGFEPIDVPRYTVPLTSRGRIAVRLGLQHGVKSLIPAGLQARMRKWRARAYEFRGS